MECFSKFLFFFRRIGEIESLDEGRTCCPPFARNTRNRVVRLTPAPTMAPDPRAQHESETTTTVGSIITGHKIALNVHYEGQDVEEGETSS